ncbi:MAG: methyltransferase [Saccharospirillaceae bacterium]|nr:16S rRNA methyltransferase [Pseudomonadales bacterium]NRB81913.1 methyltransferase [Saccharospirillaceae bacterium]
MSTPIQSISHRFFEKQSELFEYKKAFVINPEDIYLSIEPLFDEITYVCIREDQTNDKCKNTSIINFLNTKLEAQSDIFLVLPKAKKLTEILLHWLSQQDLEQIHLWVLGENELGAKSFEKFAAKYGFQCQQLDNARRCRVFEMYPLKQEPKQTLKPFDLTTYTKSFEHQSKTLKTLPGVFSHGHIDKGTLTLLNFLEKHPQPIKGKVLDFACGCGIIAQYCTAFSSDVSGLDSDYFAIFCATQSNQLNNTDIRFFSQNGLAKVAETKYDWIVSNPPFHENKRTNYSITEKFITQSKSHLKSNGHLLIVVNDFLDYESTIKESFKNIKILYQSKGFKIIKASH